MKTCQGFVGDGSKSSGSGDTMINTNCERFIRNRSATFPAPDTDAIRVSPRSRPAGNTDGDRTLIEDVARALCAAGYPALRNIQIESERGIVMLWGCVPTYHQKQLAQVMAQQVDGVRGIANGIEVMCCR
jgi:osmotically-inducible protein OsmY